MNKRPDLNIELDSKTFKEYYYLKEELVAFCKKNGLQAVGSKIELTDRIATYLATKEKTYINNTKRRTTIIDELTTDSIIENNFVCSEIHRAFFKKYIGNSFKFNVLFQKWLKNNAGKTYNDAIKAYYEILEDKKNNKHDIDKQFEYNTYIRDFFASNKDKSLKDAIKCWNYKKEVKGHHKYENDDLKILLH